MVLSFFRKDPSLEAGQALYVAAVDQAREPALYMGLGAPDTVEGRFEMIALHAYAIMRALRGAGPEARKTSQKLFDVMFQNMDDSLRELGVGDLSVGRKIRKMAENFYGRVGAYEDALGEPDDEKLVAAIGRNVFLDEAAPAARPIAAYMRRLVRFIEDQPPARIAGGIVQFPEIENSDDQS